MDDEFGDRGIRGAVELKRVGTRRDTHQLSDDATVGVHDDVLVRVTSRNGQDAAVYPLCEVVGVLGTGNDFPPSLTVHLSVDRVAHCGSKPVFPAFPFSKVYFSKVSDLSWDHAECFGERSGTLMSSSKCGDVDGVDSTTLQSVRCELCLASTDGMQVGVTLTVDEVKSLTGNCRLRFSVAYQQDGARSGRRAISRLANGGWRGSGGVHPDIVSQNEQRPRQFGQGLCSF